MPPKGQPRSDAVPAAPIRRAMREWLKEQGLEADSGAGEAVKKGTYYSPYRILAERAGVAEDAIYRHANDSRYQTMFFDVADKLLASVDRLDLWWRDPELSSVYERAVREADFIAPLTEEGMLKRKERLLARARASQKKRFASMTEEQKQHHRDIQNASARRRRAAREGQEAA